jgi:phosphoglycolate phosphatase-like HAD superfamily hydrolase
MLIISDIDGTLTDTNTVDTDCFLASLKTVAGIDLGSADWNQFPEATDAAIVHELLKERPSIEEKAMERKIRTDFVTRLTREASVNPDRFRPLPGAVEFIDSVRSHSRYEVALATGGWAESAQIKLRMAGIDADGLGMATSSDRNRRAEIIQLAVERSNRTDFPAVYLGDGLWDLKAARELELEFIGLGTRSSSLLAAGATAVFPDFRNRYSILNCIENLKSL